MEVFVAGTLTNVASLSLPPTAPFSLSIECQRCGLARPNPIIIDPEQVEELGGKSEGLVHALLSCRDCHTQQSISLKAS